MVKPTAQEPRSSADGGPAPRRRRSERGSLYSSTSLALPRRAARYAGPPRATRAASRRACRSHRQRWRSERRSAQAPRCGRSERSETADAVGRVRSSLPSSGAPHKPAVGGPVREQVVVVVLSAQSRPSRPALALQTLPESWRCSTACPEHTGQAPVERRAMLARRRRRARRPAPSFAEPGWPARTPAAAGKEGELPGVSSQRSHAKRHLAARET